MAAGNFPNGVFSENLCFSAKSDKIHQYQDCLPTLCEAVAHALMAPSAKVKFLFGITKSGSTSKVLPKPVQCGQAPYGELKEKRRGSISGSEIPQSGQAKC